MLLCLIVSLALVLLIIQPALAQKKLTAAEAGNPESAGINRHVVGDARALQERK